MADDNRDDGRKSFLAFNRSPGNTDNYNIFKDFPHKKESNQVM